MSETFRVAAKWTRRWVIGLILLLVIGKIRAFEVPHTLYVWAIWIGAAAMIGLAFLGVQRATEYVQVSKDDPPPQPWYTDGLLVSAIIFWALFPPSFFFVEHYLIDNGFLLPPEIKPGKLMDKKDYLASSKAYADLASRVWAGSSALLAAVLAIARKAM